MQADITCHMFYPKLVSMTDMLSNDIGISKSTLTLLSKFPSS